MKCRWCGRSRECGESDDVLAYMVATSMLGFEHGQRVEPAIETDAAPERGEEGGEA